jgi:protein-tyrosine-phosphatase/DNA-binding transcriptional ArsR family regulator
MVETSERLARLHALADPVRLAVVDELVTGDVSPRVLAAALGIPGNLLAHHLNVLEQAGLVRRVRSEADRRRTYVQLLVPAMSGLLPTAPERRTAPRVVFVCTHNSARSQIAAALWRTRSTVPVDSGGTHPAREISPGAVAAARRHGLRLNRERPQPAASVLRPGDLVVSVCDAAHEELEDDAREHVHWSVPDPVRVGTDEAFDRAYDLVKTRVTQLSESVQPESES